MAGRGTATQPDWRAEDRELARELQRLARADLEDLSHAELREREHHPDPHVAAGAADMLARPSKPV